MQRYMQLQVCRKMVVDLLDMWLEILNASLATANIRLETPSLPSTASSIMLGSRERECLLCMKTAEEKPTAFFVFLMNDSNEAETMMATAKTTP